MTTTTATTRTTPHPAPPPGAVTLADWQALLVDRFGPNPAGWAFVCPACGDVASGADFKTALAEHPRHRAGRPPVTYRELLGQECIGRTLGALVTSGAAPWQGRGCNWTAYGLVPGPVTVMCPDGALVRTFRPAPGEVEE